MTPKVHPSKAAAAAAVATLIQEGISADGAVCLPGGATVKAVYFLLAKMKGLPWGEVYFCDERYAPPTHPDSNFRAFNDLVAAPLGLDPAKVHRIPTESKDPAADARRYETLLRARWPKEPAPRFDLLLLGLGRDGTVASLVPGVAALSEQERWVSSVSLLAEHEPGSARHEGPPARVTLTPAGLSGAARTVVLAVGKEKKEAVRDAAAGKNAALPRGFELVVDREAAELL